jgi:hypothetical protein
MVDMDTINLAPAVFFLFALIAGGWWWRDRVIEEKFERLSRWVANSDRLAFESRDLAKRVMERLHKLEVDLDEHAGDLDSVEEEVKGIQRELSQLIDDFYADIDEEDEDLAQVDAPPDGRPLDG